MKNFIVATINIFLLIVILFEFQYLEARHKAINYLTIINVDSVKYDSVKSAIEDIIPDEVKVSLFDGNKYSSSKNFAYNYKVHSVKGTMTDRD